MHSEPKIRHIKHGIYTVISTDNDVNLKFSMRIHLGQLYEAIEVHVTILDTDVTESKNCDWVDISHSNSMKFDVGTPWQDLMSWLDFGLGGLIFKLTKAK